MSASWLQRLVCRRRDSAQVGHRAQRVEQRGQPVEVQQNHRDDQHDMGDAESYRHPRAVSVTTPGMGLPLELAGGASQ